MLVIPALKPSLACVPQVVDYPAHNYSLFILGVLILWFGWYGFNPGSATAILGAGTSNAVQVAAVNTTLAPATSGLTALFCKAMLSKFRTGAHNTQLLLVAAAGALQSRESYTQRMPQCCRGASNTTLGPSHLLCALCSRV